MTRSRFWPVAVLFLAGSTGPVRAQGTGLREGPFVRDQAGLFSPAAVKEADRLLAGHEVGLYVDTLKELTADQSRSLRFWNLPGRAAFFRRLAREQAALRSRVQKDLDGVYVLICEKPAVITVIPYPDERGTYFLYDNCDELRRAFVAANHQASRDGDTSGPDKALLALVARFNAQLRDKGPVQLKVHPNPLALLTLLGGVFGLTLVLAFAGRRGNRGRARRHADLADSSPAVLGSLFGSTGAYWVYDALLKPRPARPRRPVHAAGSPPAAGETTSVLRPAHGPTWGEDTGPTL